MNMTLEEAIKHAEAAAIENEKEAKRKREHGGTFYDDEAQACSICAEQHRQLAEWLKELQETRKERDYWQEKAHSYEQTIFKLTDAISKQPEIIYCGECELKIECCRNIRSGGRKDDDFCSCGRRPERRTDG